MTYIESRWRTSNHDDVLRITMTYFELRWRTSNYDDVLRITRSHTQSRRIQSIIKYCVYHYGLRVVTINVIHYGLRVYLYNSNIWNLITCLITAISANCWCVRTHWVHLWMTLDWGFHISHTVSRQSLVSLLQLRWCFLEKQPTLNTVEEAIQRKLKLKLKFSDFLIQMTQHLNRLYDTYQIHNEK